MQTSPRGEGSPTVNGPNRTSGGQPAATSRGQAAATGFAPGSSNRSSGDHTRRSGAGASASVPVDAGVSADNAGPNDAGASANAKAPTQSSEVAPVEEQPPMT